VEELRRLRVQRGYSQRQLAAHSGIDQGSISEIEAGKRSPSVSTLERLVGAMNAEVGDLFPKVQRSLLEESEQGQSPFLDSWTSCLVELKRQWEAALPDPEELHANPRLAFEVLSRNESVQAEGHIIVQAVFSALDAIPRETRFRNHGTAMDTTKLTQASYLLAVTSEKWSEIAVTALEVARNVTELRPDLALVEERFERAAEHREQVARFEESRSLSA